MRQFPAEAGLDLGGRVVLTAACRVDRRGVAAAALAGLAAEAPGVTPADLLAFDAVLASTGLNLNDDYFDAGELWAARDTPRHKPVNLRHESPLVVGHMVDTRALLPDLTPAAGPDAPAAFHLAFAGFLYRFWPTDAARQAEMDLVAAAVEGGRARVSMECLFDDFDYVLFPGEAAGDVAAAGATLVERNPATAALSRHLRAYGGAGTYRGQKIGRVFRSIAFTAVGLVESPANPHSVVLAGRAAARVDRLDALPVYEPFEEPTHMPTEPTDLAAKLAEALADKAKAAAELDALKAAKHAEAVEAAKAELAQARAALDGAKAEALAAKAEAEAAKVALAAAEAGKAELAARLAALEAEAQAAAAAAKLAGRVGRVKAAYGLETDAAAEKAAGPLAALDDAAFDAHLAAMADFRPAPRKPSDLAKTVPAEAPPPVVPTENRAEAAAAADAQLTAEMTAFFGRAGKAAEPTA